MTPIIFNLSRALFHGRSGRLVSPRLFPFPRGKGLGVRFLNSMQLSDVENLLVIDPSVALMLIDQPRLDSRRSRTFDVNRIDIAGKFHFVRTDAEPLECDLKDPRVRLRDADDMRVDNDVEVPRQSE